MPFSTFILLLLQLGVLPCSARSGRRSSSPTLENSPSLSAFNGLNGSLCVFRLLFSDFPEGIKSDISEELPVLLIHHSRSSARCHTMKR